MAAMMGLENMGGAAVGFLPTLPTPTVARGEVMRHDAEGNMIGDHAGRHGGQQSAGGAGAQSGGDPHAGHTMPAAPAATADSAHAGHDSSAATGEHATHLDSAASHDTPLMELQMRMLRDPATLARLRADSAMRAAFLRSLDSLPAEHRAHMESMLRGDAAAEHEHGGEGGASKPAGKPVKAAPKKVPAPATKPAPKPAPAPGPHSGHGAPPPP